MVDHIDDASEPRGRVDIRVGVGRRRRWSVATKGRIVAESYAPGAVVSEVARRHDMSPQHLVGWRKAARAGLLTLPADEVPIFVPIVREARDDGVVAAAVGVTVSGVITIEIAGAVVRAERGVDICRDLARVGHIRLSEAAPT